MKYDHINRRLIVFSSRIGALLHINLQIYRLQSSIFLILVFNFLSVNRQGSRNEGITMERFVVHF